MRICDHYAGTLYVNEEVKHRRVNPGRAAMLAVGLLAIIYTLAQVGFQGVLSPAKLAAASANGTALVDVANALGGGFWAKVMALSIALSVIAATGTGIVLSSRLVYGMASYRVLPQFLANVSRRFATPVAASIIVGLLIIGLSSVYFLATSVQNAFTDVIDVTGLLFSIFYILTALTVVVYYRRRLTANLWEAVVLGVLPLAAAGFLGWILVKSLLAAGADAALVAGRHHHRRADHDGGRTRRAPVVVLPDPAGERARPAALRRGQRPAALAGGRGDHRLAGGRV